MLGLSAVLCASGVILPSLIITAAAANFFPRFQKFKNDIRDSKGIRLTVFSLITRSIVTVSLITLFHINSIKLLIASVKNIEIYSIIILLGSLLLLYGKNKHPFLVITIAEIAGILFWQVIPMMKK